MELTKDELKLLIINLQKKKETANKEDLEKIDIRIRELTKELKKDLQEGINKEFINILSLVESSVVNEDYAEIRTVKEKLELIIQYQSELQDVEIPINFYFDCLVIPLKNNTRNTQVVNPIQETKDLQIQETKDLQKELEQKRNIISELITQENYQKIYELIKNHSGKVDTFGVGDLLNKVTNTGQTVLDLIKLYESHFTTNTNFTEVSEDPLAPVQVNYPNQFKTYTTTWKE